MTQVKIQSLTLYPVKSLAGIQVNAAKVTPKGLAGDREWMVVKPNGKMLTQRQAGSMVTVIPSFIHSNLNEPTLRLSHALHGSIDVQLTDSNDTISVKVHADECQGIVATDEVNEWLTRAINWHQPLRLVKFAKQNERSPGQPDRFGYNATYFADAAPFLIANEQSLAALNKKLHDEQLPCVDMRHFRPNITLSGIPAFEEHTMSQLRRGELRMKLVDHCQRCVMITVDPETGENLAKATPFAQLAQMNPMPNNTKAPAFGVNAIVEHLPAEGLDLSVGDEMAIQL